jgi:Flp pilus assembly protein TadG
MGGRIWRSLRAVGADESGQSLVIVALSMTVVIAIAAFAIDVGTWYAKHHQAQVAADAAALAAANCLANSGSGKTCTSTSDVTDAQNVAVTYAADNGITITASQVNVDTANDTVSVQASPAAPAFFANLFGIHSSTQTANSEAGWTATSTTSTCTLATQSQCAAIYAGSTSCAGGGNGVEIGTPSSGGTAPVISGVVHSEGSMSFSNATMTASALTVAGSCYTSGNLPNNNHMTATQVASQPWPVNYAASPYFTACTTNCISVNGIANVPPYCTQASTGTSGYAFTNINGNPELPVANNVYCSIGTGNSKDPSTWNGPINFQASMPVNQQDNTGISSCPGFAVDTFIGGTMTFLGQYGGGMNACMKPYLDNCLIYSTGTVVIENSGGFFWTGDIFDPVGTIQLGSASSGGLNSGSSSGLLEGLNVTLQNASLTMTGDGPPATVTSGGSSTGTDTLLQ